jgi:hypothetical protein
MVAKPFVGEILFRILPNLLQKLKCIAKKCHEKRRNFKKVLEYLRNMNKISQTTNFRDHHNNFQLTVTLYCLLFNTLKVHMHAIFIFCF